MKLSGAKAAAFCLKPQPSFRVVLVFGADPGLVSASADQIAKAWLPDPDPINIVRMTDEDIKKDEARLADELVARSLLGGDRLVRLRMDRETYARQVIETLTAIENGSLKLEAAWIIEGGDLGKSSKLRAAFEASSAAMALHLFADDERSVGDFLAQRLREAKIEIEPAALALLSSELPGDRRLAMAEVEKLELYALDLGRSVSVEDVRLISSAEQARGADDAADAAIAGDAVAASIATQRFLDAGGSPISAMRTLHFRMLRLSDAVATDAANGFRLRPPVFERDWPAFSRAMRSWTPQLIQRAFARLYEAEKDCKQAGAPAESILGTLMLRIAKRAV